MIFVNLPVRDLAASIRFYKGIGCEQNHQFSNDQAAMMVWSEAISFMLLTHDFYATFTQKKIADAHETSEVLLALSRDSRADVDAITEAAAEAGGRADVRPPQDMGFMYSRAFEDPDGHVFEPAWMDVEAAFSASGEQPAKSA
jgi:predicted lactoylglutathione lyase